VLILDSASAIFLENEDELLATVALAKAKGVPVAVATQPEESVADFDSLLEELCSGLIARTTADIPRVVTLLGRRADPHRSQRFEFVTVAPGSSDLLAVLNDGRCSIVPRPVDADDDGTDVVGIELEEGAGAAYIHLDSGRSLRLPMARTSAGVDATPLPGGMEPDDGLAFDGKRLGARLRELRKAAGLTQAELARRTGIHRPNIARVEAGRHTPSLETLARLAAAIGVPTTAVISRG
jgi:DNA-binding XRE family transcriptional regulator